MTNEHMAASALSLAEKILMEAERHHSDGAWGLAVRRSQEVVELSLKALLRFMGLEVPRVHDVGGFVRKYRDRLPTGLRTHLDEMARISRTLREEREISFCGDEESGFALEELYTAADSEKAVSEARFVYGLCAEQMRKGKKAKRR